MRRIFSALVAVVAALVIAAPVGAITNGVPDAREHPYVGELLFYVPDAADSRFDDPGGWFTCSGTLLNSTTVVTAGHCTFGVGRNGVSTTDGGTDTTAAQGGTGGNDVWINFDEVPDFSILPPSSTFGRDENPERYAAWAAALNADSHWHRATAYPHAQYDDNAFFVHDAGVLKLSSPVSMSTYGHVASLRYLDRYQSAPRNVHRFETVGYGLERVQGKKEFGGDTRMKSTPKLISLAGQPRNTYMVISNNTATGGTCFGDSGGPTFDNTTSNLVVAVTSWGQSPNCGGKGGVYRLD
ncbi:MAG: trypsin-like serine protease, partial [Gaiellaceae bacterium]